MAAGLAIAGVAVFVLLAVGHTVFMIQSSPEGGPMTPVDPTIREVLTKPGGIGMAPGLQSTLFRSWTGFNHSHSLGIFGFAFVALVQIITDFDRALDEIWFLVLVGVVPVAYLGLSLRYWFSKPTQGIFGGTLLLWSGVLWGLVAA